MDKTIKAILWDADGVVLKPRDKYFSDRLREDYGLDVPQYKILPFFTNEYKQIVIGKANIKDELQKYISDWGWQDTVEELLQYWFSYENKINQDILNLVASLRQAGTKCYIASDHSKYRADDLMKNVSMNQYFDGGLFSCDLGTTKDKPEFFSKITHQLKLKPEQILFIDDEQENIDAAHQAGIRARFFRSVRSLIEDLGQLGFNDLQNLDNKIKDDIGNVQKAGGVVLKKNGKKFLLLVYRAKHNDWGFPKGHVEENETLEETALNEVKEKAGVKVNTIKELPPNKYLNSRTGEQTTCHMYLMEPLTSKIKPEFEGDKVEWVPLNKVRDKLSHDNPKQYFNLISAVIDEQLPKIVSRCGIICSECEYREKCKCPTCHKTNGKPFWGECKVAKCNIFKGLNNCSECDNFPCKLLISFAYDKEQGDNGKRIENLKALKNKGN